MKNFKILFACLILGTASASCTYDFQNEDYGPLITLSPMAGAAETKAPIMDNVFPDRDIVVSSYFYADNGGTSDDYFSNLTFSKSGSTWAADKYWPLGGQLDFLAVSSPQLNPELDYTGDKVTDEVRITIGDNSSIQEDILCAYAGQTSSVNSVSMSFVHAQALITFKAQSSIAYNSTTNVGITVTGITINGARYSGTCMFTKNGNCAWGGLGPQKDVAVPGLSATNLGTTMSGQLGAGIMLPSQACTTATITYTLHNGKQNGTNLDIPGLVKTITLTSPDTNWLSSKSYCYEICITQHGISFEPVVSDWIVTSPVTVNIS